MDVHGFQGRNIHQIKIVGAISYPLGLKQTELTLLEDRIEFKLFVLIQADSL